MKGFFGILFAACLRSRLTIFFRRTFHFLKSVEKNDQKLRQWNELPDEEEVEVQVY